MPLRLPFLDGVLFIKGQTKMYKAINESDKDHTILSALVLREFLYSL